MGANLHFDSCGFVDHSNLFSKENFGKLKANEMAILSIEQKQEEENTETGGRFSCFPSFHQF